jgi:hypothetical protein
MSVASWTGSLLAWEGELSALKGRLGPMFGRRESRETGGAFLDGLLSGVARKTGWLLAEQAGAARPYPDAVAARAEPVEGGRSER